MNNNFYKICTLLWIIQSLCSFLICIKYYYTFNSMNIESLSIGIILLLISIINFNSKGKSIFVSIISNIYSIFICILSWLLILVASPNCMIALILVFMVIVNLFLSITTLIRSLFPFLTINKSVKTGVSGGKISKDGKSVRTESQVKKMEQRIPQKQV